MSAENPAVAVPPGESRAVHAAQQQLETSLLGLVTGCWVSQAIYVAAKLGIADLIGAGPKSCQQLAAATQTDPGALFRVLRALAGVGIFAEDAAGQFRLTPLAAQLQSGAPGSLRALAILMGEKEHWRAWEAVLHSVRTGQSAFAQVFGVPLFQYLSTHPETARIFDEAMTSRSGAENSAILAAYDFSAARVAIDVGGGQGSLLESILLTEPGARGILVDLPHVRNQCRARLAETGQEHRCEFRAGDFFAGVPEGGDVYLLKRIIHDWDDWRSELILENCRKAMPPASRLLVIEPIVPPGNAPSFSKLLDLLMLVWQEGGRERTESEHRALLVAAGFTVNRIIPTVAGISIIEAVPT
jgi:hypothetical protein